MTTIEQKAEEYAKSICLHGIHDNDYWAAYNVYTRGYEDAIEQAEKNALDALKWLTDNYEVELSNTHKAYFIEKFNQLNNK